MSLNRSVPGLIYVIIAVAAVVAVASGVTLGSLENMMSAVRPIA